MLAFSLLTLGMAAVASAGVVPELIETRDVNNKTLHLPLAPVTVISQVQRGGPNVTFQGTWHEIAAAMEKENPYWVKENLTLSELFPNHTAEVPVGHPDYHKLQARSNRISYVCDNGFQPAGWISTMVNVKYLYSSYFGPGSQCQTAARTCGRFACNNDAAILMCNDNPFPVTIDCATLAMNANFIFNSCGQPFWQRAEGQAFYINPSYNVLIKHTDKGKGC